MYTGPESLRESWHVFQIMLHVQWCYTILIASLHFSHGQKDHDQLRYRLGFF